MKFWQSYCKNKTVQFFCLSVSYSTSRRVPVSSPFFVSTHFACLGGLAGLVGMDGWLNTKLCKHDLNPWTVTHPSTNRARRRGNTLIETNAPQPRQTITNGQMVSSSSHGIYGSLVRSWHIDPPDRNMDFVRVLDSCVFQNKLEFLVVA